MRRARAPLGYNRYNFSLNSFPSNVNIVKSIIKCLYTNIDSIRNKKFIFKRRIEEVQPHTILISESKLNLNDQVSEYFKIAII